MPFPFDRRDVVDPYDTWFATPYGKFVDRIEIELILDLLGPRCGRGSLLEIGCGTGWFGRELSEKGFRVTGVDLSELMLGRARHRIPVVRADAARLPFADRAFDDAFMIAVLDFLPDPVAVLREARRVVRGRVVLTALASGSWLGWRRRVSAARGHPVFSRARFYSRRRLIALARAAGAEPEGVRGALFLPPSIAPFVPQLEDSLRRHMTLGAGIVAFSLPSLG